MELAELMKTIKEMTPYLMDKHNCLEIEAERALTLGFVYYIKEKGLEASEFNLDRNYLKWVNSLDKDYFEAMRNALNKTMMGANESLQIEFLVDYHQHYSMMSKADAIDKVNEEVEFYSLTFFKGKWDELKKEDKTIVLECVLEGALIDKIEFEKKLSKESMSMQSLRKKKGFGN
jgi:methionine synthase II (cobalamin-independent)